VSAVVWATGYHSDYSWIHLPVLGPDSLPRHKRGVATESPGLYFLGMHNQTSRGSSLIYWVRHDAAYIAGQVRAPAARAGAGALPGEHGNQEEAGATPPDGPPHPGTQAQIRAWT
jgi:putative flavoprotein involved in K+ transport